MNLLQDFQFTQLLIIFGIFIWTGFVRTGLGFGGAALGLPLMLFIYDDPIFWLPIIGAHLLFFSGLTLGSKIKEVDWKYLKSTMHLIFVFTVIGVLGLIQLPTSWLILFIYGITLFYSILWVSGITLKSKNKTFDKFMLAIGGYVAGTSLTGAPLIVAVFAQNVSPHLLRNTLFVLWFSIVLLKMAAFIAVGIELNLFSALILIPAAAIGHVLGLKAHHYILKNNQVFQRVTGGVLILISLIGLYGVLGKF